MKVDFNNPTMQYSQTKYNPLWDLMIYPTSRRRYPPKGFHVGMWNEWTGEVCTEHPHKFNEHMI